MKSDYDIIKKAYGENFAKLCRTLFPQILEKEGVLPDLMMSLFAPSRFLYDDVMADGKEAFQNFVMGKFYETHAHLLSTENKTERVPTPEELFDKAGYVLTKCETDEDVKSFMHYYQPNERLCTFRDPNRINTNTIFWAVKKNVDEIRREDFKSPMRQDEYGTSVISLQFTKGETSLLSIKNRYNHTVQNPDNTFSNDLENIYPSLTRSFEEHYGIHQVENAGQFEMSNYVLANDGRRYRYNYEDFNTYYCPNNIIIRNGEVEYYDRQRYEIVDYFIIDKQEKTLVEAPNMEEEDSFADAHKNIDKIEVEKVQERDGEKRITITMKDNAKAILTINKYNCIIAYSNESLTKCGKLFLGGCNYLTELNLPALTQCEDDFLLNNESLTKLHLPALTQCGNDFLLYNQTLTELNLPTLTKCGNRFLYNNQALTKLDLPALTQCGNAFLFYNKTLSKLNLPTLTQCGNGFLNKNEALTELNLPALTQCGNGFLFDNQTLTKLNLPALTQCGNDFLSNNNRSLTELDLPALTQCGNYFLSDIRALNKLNAPNLPQHIFERLHSKVTKNLNNENDT